MNTYKYSNDQAVPPKIIKKIWNFFLVCFSYKNWMFFTNNLPS